MMDLDQIRRLEEYRELPQREQAAVVLAYEGILARRKLGKGGGLRVVITPEKPFDIYGFRKACAAAEINANFPQNPAPDGSYMFIPSDDPSIKPEEIHPRNIGEKLLHGAAAIRKEEEERKLD